MDLHLPIVHPGAAPAGNVEMGHQAPAAAVNPPPPAAHDQPAVNQQQLGGQGPNTWVGNDANTLLVVATLITTLTYQLGTNIPGGYWQETKSVDGRELYRAGDPIMRDLHRPRYWLFMAASWAGFASSMVMTLSLLVRMSADSRHVRWSFVVAYSSLVLTFVVSQPRTHLSMDILVWAGVLAFLWLVISVHPEHRTRIVQALCCSHRN
ncbi:hypothetical protein CFC21_051651 [Triticum aestivum]|uniref:PGG domain-containing protein n=4 Tax=Triticum TaxID=4564 RepID=A0A9R0VVC2_TRITD|nr:uncharacterized protein LOC119288721 [Triticum dicoccoides]XP_044360259.1 uncharacterized protein LOC123081800 [Triticum aestivum]XP_048573607.1 uncharacterized protein LOC125554022 [Triticum urartu]KAF7041931.1 hypothetical protein CFC21_051651 [Triticum aestivum]VAH88968.1 unnamed protein product [Triticum turgidum subsp. durum]